jgi:membrane protein YdbS with pleckstrin-like domain
MSLVQAVVVFVVGFLAGTVTRWIAGLAAIVALVLVVLGAALPEIGLVTYVVEQYYLGNELLFIAGFLFGIDAERAREVAVGRRASEE